MKDFEGTIDFLVVDNDYTLIRSVDLADGLPVSAFFVVKELSWDSDDDAIINKEITAVESDDGLIATPEEDAESTSVTFNISKNETHELHPFFKYVYVIRYKTDEDKYFTQETGILTPLAGITAVE